MFLSLLYSCFQDNANANFLTFSFTAKLMVTSAL